MNEQGNVVRRSIGIVFSDGGLLALTSELPEDGAGIDDEEVTAALCELDGVPLTFEESLLSTEYGEDGVQRRVTLELWPDVEEMRPLRGAGSLISSIRVPRHELDSRVAFFRWSVGGGGGRGTHEGARQGDG